MKRREFIAAIGGAAAWPLAARAQQTDKLPVVGFLNGQSFAAYRNNLDAFRLGLGSTGYSEGRNVTVEYRWAEGQYERLPALAAELVRRQVAVIVSAGSDASTEAAIAATRTIPIVFLYGGDPVARGVVTSFNRPDGNATGISMLTTALEAKRVELLHQMVPNATKFAVLVNPAGPNATAAAQETQEAAHKYGLEVHVFNASRENELEPAFQTFGKLGITAFQVVSDAFFLRSRETLVTLAARYEIPAMYNSREIPAAGGLMSYGASIVDTYRQVGIYTGRILGGIKPSDLPVLQPTKFELVINLKTAKTLGLNVPTGLLVAADEVIE